MKASLIIHKVLDFRYNEHEEKIHEFVVSFSYHQRIYLTKCSECEIEGTCLNKLSVIFYIKVMICHTWFTLPKHGPRGLESPDPPDGGLGQPQHRLAVTSGHRRRGRKLGQRQQLDRVFWILSLCWSPSWLQPQRSGITAIPTRGESHHSNIVSIWHLMGCHRLTSYVTNRSSQSHRIKLVWM